MKLVTDKTAFVGDWINVSEETDHPLMMTTNMGASIYLQTNQTAALSIAMFNHAEAPSKPQTIAIKIDEAAYQSYELRHEPIQLELPDEAEHQIRIVTQGNAMHESGGARYWVNNEKFYFEGAETAEGIIAGAAPQRPNLFFVGDSITAGHKLTATHQSPLDHQAHQNYAALTADALNVNDIRIAYGGTGITPEAAIPVPTGIDFLWKLDTVHPRPLHQDEPAMGVVVNIGTNDHEADEQEFTFSLKIFIQELHKRFHELPIYMLIPFNQQFAEIFRTVTQDDAQIQLIETAGWGVTNTDAYHPDVAGTQQAAQHLIEELRKRS